MPSVLWLGQRPTGVASGIKTNSLSLLGVVTSRGNRYYRYARGSSSRSRYFTHQSCYHASEKTATSSRVYREDLYRRYGLHPSRS